MRFLVLFFAITIVICSCRRSRQDADQHYSKGLELHFSGDLRHARDEYLLTIKADSLSWKGYYGMASVCQLEGDFKSAISYFSKVIKLHPGNALAYY